MSKKNLPVDWLVAQEAETMEIEVAVNLAAGENQSCRSYIGSDDGGDGGSSFEGEVPGSQSQWIHSVDTPKS